MRWSPRTKAFFTFYTWKQIYVLCQAPKLSMNLLSNVLVGTSAPLLFNIFFSNLFLQVTSLSNTNVQKKLTSSFTRTLSYWSMSSLFEYRACSYNFQVHDELQRVITYFKPLKLPYFFYVQPNYTALLQFFMRVMVSQWNALTTTQSSTSSRWTLDTKFYLLRFFNLYFFKVANL